MSRPDTKIVQRLKGYVGRCEPVTEAIPRAGRNFINQEGITPFGGNITIRTLLLEPMDVE
jgi:hypothetical protein